MNIITLQGRLTKDPEERKTISDKAVSSFSLAVKREFGDETDFIDCVAYAKTAEFVNQYFKKGDGMIVEGRLQIRDWRDKEDKPRRTAEVVVNRVEFPISRKEPVMTPVEDNGELPF